MSLETRAATEAYYYLIIDDSEIIRVQLSRSIAAACAEVEANYHYYQVNRNGQLTEQIIPAANITETTLTYHVYTAPTCKLALKVLELPNMAEITLLSDMSIPGDTEIGLLGLLEALARRQLPVNLIFISSEYQNRVRVEPLLQKGKAYFIEKGTPTWDSLAQALVRQATNFKYQRLAFNDFSTAARPTTNPASAEKIIRPAVVVQPPRVASEPPAEPVPVASALIEQPAEPIANGFSRAGLFEALKNTVRDLPGKAGAMGASGVSRARELPQLLKNLPQNLPLPRRKDNPENLPKDRDTNF